MTHSVLGRTLAFDQLGGKKKSCIKVVGHIRYEMNKISRLEVEMRLTRLTVTMRSLAGTFGSLREGSILCTQRGTFPVPSFSTKRWLRKSSSLERSRMFMIFVGRHVNGAPRREWEPAADAEGIELDNGDDEAR